MRLNSNVFIITNFSLASSLKMQISRCLLNFKHLNKWKVLLAPPNYSSVLWGNTFSSYKVPICLDNLLVRSISTAAVLNKYIKQSSKDDDSDSDDDNNDPELKDERDSKVVKVKVNSLRADLILRAGLSIARNKIEVIFYESKIRVNGKKIVKKSTHLNEGDEVDVIRGFSNVNPSHLIVSRVIIISAKEKDDAISVNLRRYKNMLIENYSGVNIYKSSETVA